MKFDFRDGDPGWTGIDMTRERDGLSLVCWRLGKTRGSGHVGRGSDQAPRCLETLTYQWIHELPGWQRCVHRLNGNELLLVAPAEARTLTRYGSGKIPLS